MTISQTCIYIKENGVVKYARTVTYGMMDLIGFFGGIIGLCVGFSLLSGAELIYFFTLRLFFDIKNEKENKVENLNDLDDIKCDKDILSDSFDAVFSLNNSTVGLVTSEEGQIKTKETVMNKPDVVPKEDNTKSLDVPKNVATKNVSPKSSPKKAPVKPAQKPKTPAK